MKDKDSILLENAYTTVASYSIKKIVAELVEEPVVSSIITESNDDSPQKNIEQAYNEAIKDINNKRIISEENISIISSDKKIAKRLAHNLILLGRELPSAIKEIII